MNLPLDVDLLPVFYASQYFRSLVGIFKPRRGSDDMITDQVNPSMLMYYSLV